MSFDTSLQKIANVIPTAGVKQGAKVHGPLVVLYAADHPKSTSLYSLLITILIMIDVWWKSNENCKEKWAEIFTPILTKRKKSIKI